jgi:hypothetical protein
MKSKYQQLVFVDKVLLPVFGFNNLSDFQSSVSMNDLKKRIYFLDQINNIIPEFKKTFPMAEFSLYKTKYIVNNVDQAFGLLKKTLLLCTILHEFVIKKKIKSIRLVERNFLLDNYRKDNLNETKKLNEDEDIKELKSNANSNANSNAEQNHSRMIETIDYEILRKHTAISVDPEIRIVYRLFQCPKEITESKIKYKLLIHKHYGLMNIIKYKIGCNYPIYDHRPKYFDNLSDNFNTMYMDKTLIKHLCQLMTMRLFVNDIMIDENYGQQSIPADNGSDNKSDNGSDNGLNNNVLYFGKLLNPKIHIEMEFDIDSFRCFINTTKNERVNNNTIIRMMSSVLDSFVMFIKFDKYDIDSVYHNRINQQTKICCDWLNKDLIIWHGNISLIEKQYSKLVETDLNKNIIKTMDLINNIDVDMIESDIDNIYNINTITLHISDEIYYRQHITEMDFKTIYTEYNEVLSDSIGITIKNNTRFIVKLTDEDKIMYRGSINNIKLESNSQQSKSIQNDTIVLPIEMTDHQYMDGIYNIVFIITNLDEDTIIHLHKGNISIMFQKRMENDTIVYEQAEIKVMLVKDKEMLVVRVKNFSITEPLYIKNQTIIGQFVIKLSKQCPIMALMSFCKLQINMTYSTLYLKDHNIVDNVCKSDTFRYDLFELI